MTKALSGREWVGLRVEITKLHSYRRGSWKPTPGRWLTLAREHTFDDLASAISIAFGRYDALPTNSWKLPDAVAARMIAGRDKAWREEDGACYEGYDESGEPRELDLSDVRVLDTVPPKRIFRFFYRSDPSAFEWEHACLADRALPSEIAERFDAEWPILPVAFRGWGWVPDANEDLWDTLPEGTGPHGSWRPSTRRR